MQAEWSIPWNATIEAYCFVFPHRREELLSWCWHIERLFYIYQVFEHHRILNYDCQVRHQAADTRAFLLDHYEQFINLKKFWLSGAISVTAAGASIAQVGNPSKTFESCSSDPCRNFNRGQCSKNKWTCCFQHVCIDCQSASHVQGALSVQSHTRKARRKLNY